MGDDFMIVYTGFSDAGPLVRLATTRDFVGFERRGTLMTPEDKDAALFPITFGGQYALIHRPVMSEPGHLAHIWLSRSPDLHFWGDHTILLPARHGGWWDAKKIGLGPPPLLTERGWLVLYHSVRTTVIGQVYRLGLALLEPDRPEQVIARSSEWMFGPDEPYEGTVVFPCGWTLEDDDDTLRMYYGAGDASICVATASLRALLRWLERHSS